MFIYIFLALCISSGTLDAQHKKRDHRKSAKQKVSTSVVFSQAALVIAPFSVRGDSLLRPEKEEDINPAAFVREIRQRLPEAIRDQFGFDTVSLDEQNFLVEMERYNVPYRGGRLTLNLPAESSSYMSGSEVADYILLVQNATITPAEKAVAEGVSTNYMLSFTFALWDNVLGELHSYGVLRAPVSTNSNEETWGNIAKHIAQTMHVKLAITEKEPLPKSLNFRISFQPRFHLTRSAQFSVLGIPLSDTDELRSIGRHFDDHYAIAPAIEYIFHNFKSGFGIGLEYARESLVQGSHPLIFLNEGDTPELYLTVQSYSLTLAYYEFAKSSEKGSLYVRGKLSLVDYAMDETIDSVRFEMDFEQAFGLSLGLGIRIAPPQLNFGVHFEGGYEHTNVTLNAIRVGGEETQVGKDFSDPLWYLDLGVFYALAF